MKLITIKRQTNYLFIHLFRILNNTLNINLTKIFAKCHN